MKRLLTLILSTVAIAAPAQTSQWGTPTGNPQFPKGKYTELTDPKASTDETQKTWGKVNGIYTSWVSSDARYAKSEAPTVAKSATTETLSAWRGERIGAQALVWTTAAIDSLSFTVVNPTNGKSEIPISAAFVRYVMQDNFLTCGYREKIAKWDSTLVADVIDHLTPAINVEPKTSRPIWVTVKVPADAAAGLYTGYLIIKNDDQVIGKLALKIKVLDRKLPEAKDWAFHLDMWQNPFAEARYMELEPFTPEHYAAMRPGLELLRDAGQKVITTSIMHKPWGGQTEDYFETMISWTKKADGTWAFEFDVFDSWVEYMQSLGFDGQIACYTMIPWNMSFKYYDQKSNSMKYLKTTTDTKEYRQVWTALLKSLSAHLRQKGWFDRAVISMDERPTKDMRNAFEVIKTADPEFKVSLAGGNHPEIEAELFDYSMASDDLFSPEVLKKRRENGQISTYYTCCAQKYPNLFTYSYPAQIEWIGWFAAAKNYDGYLRWAYNSYTKEPLLDARFRAFQAGDSYMIYPEGRSSIRWEKFIDGVEAFEKLRILRAEAQTKNDVRTIKKLDEVLSVFDISNLDKDSNPATTMVKARAVINSL